MYFFEDELEEGQDLSCPCFLSFFLNAIKKLLTLFSWFDSTTAVLLEVLQTDSGLILTHRELRIHVLIGLVADVDGECSYNNHDDVINDWHSILLIENFIFDWIIAW